MDIRVAAADDHKDVIDTLTLAFVSDPVVRYWFKTPSHHLQYWPPLLIARGERGLAQGTASITANAEGAAIWLAPGVEPDPEKMAALEFPGDENTEAAAAEFRVAMDQYHLEEPHWYLWAIGVDPRFQGKGVGSALLSHTLGRVDDEGKTALLECSDPKNVRFYERHGFEVMGVVQVRDIPPLTPMIRKPR